MNVPVNPKDQVSTIVNPLSKKALTMRKLIDKLPLNDLGLPNYVYRTDMIDEDLLEETTSVEERISILNAASQTLNYFEGFPAQPDGRFFWAKLEYEPSEAFMAFREYLGVVSETDNGVMTAPVRTFAAVKDIINVPEHQLMEWAFLYYWNHRVKAHDLFIVASFHKQKERRALYLEDKHYRKATAMIAQIEARIGDRLLDDDEMQEVTTKELFTMFESLLKTQRVSVGLPAAGPASNQKEDSLTNASTESKLREIAQKAGERAKTVEDEDENMDAILANPELAEKLQEMIIAASTKG